MIIKAYIEEGESSRKPVNINIVDLDSFVHAGPDAAVCVVPEGEDESDQFFVKKRDLNDLEVVGL